MATQQSQATARIAKRILGHGLVVALFATPLFGQQATPSPASLVPRYRVVSRLRGFQPSTHYDLYVAPAPDRATTVLWWDGVGGEPTEVLLRVMPLLEQGLNIVVPRREDNQPWQQIATQAGRLMAASDAECAVHWVRTIGPSYGVGEGPLVIGGILSGAFSAVMSALGKRPVVDDCAGSYPPGATALFLIAPRLEAPGALRSESDRLDLSRYVPNIPPVLLINSTTHQPADNQVAELTRRVETTGIRHVFLDVSGVDERPERWTQLQLESVWSSVIEFIRNESAR